MSSNFFLGEQKPAPFSEAPSIWVCDASEYWETQIQGSTDKYIVRYGKGINYRDITNYSWSCDCPHHMYRGAVCKHIVKAMKLRCTWNSLFREGDPVKDEHGILHCPDCGGNIHGEQINP